VAGSDLPRRGAGDQPPRSPCAVLKTHRVDKGCKCYGRRSEAAGTVVKRSGDLHLPRPPGAQRRGRCCHGLTDTRCAGQRTFDFRIGGDGNGRTTWEWLRKRSLVDDWLAAAYRDLLLKQRIDRVRGCSRASCLGGRRRDYPDSSCLFKGDFKNPPTGAALDWSMTAARRAETARGERCAGSGQSSLHVS
jgi:hypothetical protein